MSLNQVEIRDDPRWRIRPRRALSILYILEIDRTQPNRTYGSAELSKPNRTELLEFQKLPNRTKIGFLPNRTELSVFTEPNRTEPSMIDQGGAKWGWTWHHLEPRITFLSFSRRAESIMCLFDQCWCIFSTFHFLTPMKNPEQTKLTKKNPYRGSVRLRFGRTPKTEPNRTKIGFLPNRTEPRSDFYRTEPRSDFYRTEPANRTFGSVRFFALPNVRSISRSG